MSAPRVTIVAAVGANGAIGMGDRLPWRLRTDLRRYRDITMGKPMIMGRKTFESIGRPLPGRETIVLTRDPSYAAPGVHVAHDPAAALRLGADRARAMGADEVVVAGGGDVYGRFIGAADAMRLTRVDLAPAGDAFFPDVSPDEWVETARESHPAGPEDEASFVFVDYARRGPKRPLG